MPRVLHFRAPGSPAVALSAGLLLAAAVPLAAQEPISGEAPGAPARLAAADRAVLDSPEARKLLPCTVTPSKPEMGFDLIFHTGYQVGVPFRELTGDGNRLTMVFRAIPEGHAADAAYFEQQVSVPALDDADRGTVSLSGAFDLGEGKYHIDWLMRDRTERVCSFHWDTEAALAPRDKRIGLDIAAGAVRQVHSEPFRPSPLVARDRGGATLHMKAVVNFAPQNEAAAALRPEEIGALVSILRTIARDPRIARISLVAFNLQAQKVLYRQPESSRIDFPALGRALRSLNLGTTDPRRLKQKREGSQFLADLITTEVSQAAESPDALVFAGPKLGMTDAIPLDALKLLGGVKFPVFYVSYNLSPVPNPWHDTIANPTVMIGSDGIILVEDAEHEDGMAGFR